MPGLLAAKGIEGMHKRHMLAVLLNLRRCIAGAFSCKLTDPEGQDPLCLVFIVVDHKGTMLFWGSVFKGQDGVGLHCELGTKTLNLKPSNLAAARFGRGTSVTGTEHGCT